MNVYIDVVYLFNELLIRTASQQTIKYHVGKFPGGAKSIVLNKYNMIIDTILSITTQFDNIIDNIKNIFKECSIKYIIRSDYELEIPNEYNGRGWRDNLHKYVSLKQFTYYLACDIKECLIAYDKAKKIIGAKLITKMSESNKQIVEDYKNITSDWEQIAKTSPEQIETDIVQELLDKYERKQLRLIYYNYEILKNIYNVFAKKYPSLENKTVSDKYSSPKEINRYTQQIKQRLAFTQACLTNDEINKVFNYIVSSLHGQIANKIEDKRCKIISNVMFVNNDNNTNKYEYYRLKENTINKYHGHVDNICNIQTFTSIKTTMLNILREVDTSIPIIDIDPDRHLETFIQYPQNVLYIQTHKESLIKDYNWQSLQQGLNTDLFIEYEQNLQIIINKFKFNNFVII